MRKKYKLILLLSIILIPQTILANAGTALMWMPIMQLVFGNILIGIVEGFLTALFFKTKWYRSILIMVAGNYVSWLIGNGLIYLFQNVLIDSLFKLDKVYSLWLLSLFILYILTVLLELPFFRWTFAKNERLWSRSWKLSLTLNAVTYTVMILIYLNVSKYNFFTDLKINQSLLDNKTNFELFYQKNREIYSGIISPSFSSEKKYNLPDSIKYPHFYLKKNLSNNWIDLYILNFFGDTLLVQNSFLNSSEKIYYPKLVDEYSWTISDFRDTTSRNWEAEAGGWAIDGLTINNANNLKQQYAFEVPWMFWNIGLVSILNDSELVCEINGRIIILNKDTKEIAFITEGDDYIIKKRK